MFDTSKLAGSTVKRTHMSEGAHQMIADLEKAAAVFALRTDGFSAGKADTCLDLASKLGRYGSFASDKQREFAEKLISWVQPREQKPAMVSDWGCPVPKLFAVLQKHTHFYVEPMKLSRRNQDSLVWIVYAGVCIGKIENERATVWDRKAQSVGTTALKVLDLIQEFEANPLATAQKYGKESGRCCSCGRDLTDPVSIENGIGPICATKFGGF